LHKKQAPLIMGKGLLITTKQKEI